MRLIDNRILQGAVLAPVACCLVVLSARTVQAQQWYIEPRASLRTFYDDNVRLSSVREISSLAGVAKLDVEAGRRTETSKLGVQAHVVSNRYADASDLNSTNGSLNLVGAYQLGLSQLTLTGAFDYDSTLTSEVSTSGYVQTNKRRRRFKLAPSWRYRLSPRAQLETSLSYEGVSYEDVERIQLFDYSFSTAGLTLTYALSERAQAFGRATYEHYDASSVDTQSHNYGLELGASYLLSETWTISAFAGMRHSTAETPTWYGVQESDNSGPLFELNVSKKMELGQLKLTADRALLPSSSGTLLDTSALSVRLDYPLGPKWSVSLNVDGYRNRSPDSQVSSYDRDYVTFSPKIRRRLTEALYLDLSYRYRWQKYDAEANDAVSNALFIGVEYAPPREPLKGWSLL